MGGEQKGKYSCAQWSTVLTLFSSGHNANGSCPSSPLLRTTSHLNTPHRSRSRSLRSAQVHVVFSNHLQNLLEVPLTGLALRPQPLLSLSPLFTCRSFKEGDGETPCEAAHRGRLNILDGRASVPIEYEFTAAYRSANACALARLLHGKV